MTLGAVYCVVYCGLLIADTSINNKQGTGPRPKAIMMGKEEGDCSPVPAVEDHIDEDAEQHLPEPAAAAVYETVAQHQSTSTMTPAITFPDEQGGQGDNVSQEDPDPATSKKESEEAESDTAPAPGGSNRETPTGSRRASDPSSSESKYSTESLHLRKEERKSVAQLKAELAQISRRLLIEDQLADELHRRNEALYARLLQIREDRQRREQFVALDDDDHSSDSDDPGRITPDHRSVQDFSSDSSRPQEQLSVARARHSHSSSDASTTTSFAGPASKKHKSEPDQDQPNEDSKPAAKDLEEEQGQRTPPTKKDGID